jgi:hypothetical protein
MPAHASFLQVPGEQNPVLIGSVFLKKPASAHIMRAVAVEKLVPINQVCKIRKITGKVEI